MKPRIWVSLLLFISSYCPLLLLVALQDLKEFADLSWGWPHHWFKHPRISAALVLLAFASLGALALYMRILRAKRPRKVASVTPKSVDLLNYSLPYVISLISVDLDKGSNCLAVLAFLSIMFFVTHRTNNLFTNPTLLALGYQMFDLEIEVRDGEREAMTVITKARPRPGVVLDFRQITPFLWIAAVPGEDNHTEEKEKQDGCSNAVAEADPEG